MTADPGFPQDPCDVRLRRLLFAVILQAVDDACGYETYWAVDAANWLEEGADLFFDYLGLDKVYLPEILALIRAGNPEAKDKLKRLKVSG